MDWSKFDKQVDLNALKQDVKEAANNQTGFEELPLGTYAVKVDRMELKPSKKNDPMVSIWFKVIEGQNQNRLIFYNRVINQAFGIHMANEFLRSMGVSANIEFESYAQYANLLLDLSEEIEQAGLTYDLEVSEGKNGYREYKILEVYE